MTIRSATVLVVLLVGAAACTTEPTPKAFADVTVALAGPARTYRSDSVVWGLFPGTALDREIEVRLPVDIGVAAFQAPRLYLLCTAPCPDGQVHTFGVGNEAAGSAWLDTRYGAPGTEMLNVTFGVDSGRVTLTSSDTWTQGTFDVWVQYGALHLTGAFRAAVGTPASWWPGAGAPPN